MSIYTGQRIPLSTFFTEEETDLEGNIIKVVVDITGATIRYDYWKPGNAPPNPASGFVNGTVVDGPTGEASGSITAIINDTAGNWIVQGNAIIGSDEWPECAKKYKVLDRGKTCS